MVGKRSAWMAVPGIAIWAQLFLGAALAEWHYADMRLLYVAAYFLPLIVMGVGYWIGRVGWLQIGFIASLLPAFLILPDEDLPALDNPVAVMWLCVLVALYLAMGTDWVTFERAEAREDEGGGLDSAVDANQERRTGFQAEYQQHFVSRFVVAMWLFGVITYAVYFDSGIQAYFGEHFEGSEQVAVSFVAISMFFVWCMVVYMMIVVPAMNLEYDQRRLQLSTAAMAQTKVRRLAGTRVLVLILLSVATVWAVFYL